MTGILKDTKYRDERGERIWFPKDGKPYYDRALGKTFTSIKEKHEFMKKNRLIMDGSMSPKVWPVEAGDNRNKSHRRAMRIED